MNCACMRPGGQEGAGGWRGKGGVGRGAAGGGGVQGDASQQVARVSAITGNQAKATWERAQHRAVQHSTKSQPEPTVSLQWAGAGWKGQLPHPFPARQNTPPAPAMLLPPIQRHDGTRPGQVTCCHWRGSSSLGHEHGAPAHAAPAHAHPPVTPQRRSRTGRRTGGACSPFAAPASTTRCSCSGGRRPGTRPGCSAQTSGRPPPPTCCRGARTCQAGKSGPTVTMATGRQYTF